jgi:hypothetical protein
MLPPLAFFAFRIWLFILLSPVGKGRSLAILIWYEMGGLKASTLFDGQVRIAVRQVSRPLCGVCRFRNVCMFYDDADTQREHDGKEHI